MSAADTVPSATTPSAEVKPGACAGSEPAVAPDAAAPNPAAPAKPAAKPVPEIGGPKGPEPTRYGDWEVNGRCSDF